MTDWKTARVVQADGELWGRTLGRWEMLDPHAHRPLTDSQLAPYAPVPVLDADRMPVVRKVGDLTARHIGRRVLVGGLNARFVGVEDWTGGVGDGIRAWFEVGVTTINAYSPDDPCELLP